MKRAMIGILCAALAAPLMWTATAHGADPPADGFARQRALFEEGKRLYGEGRWAEARAVFLEVWAMRKSYDVAAYLGDIELMLGQARSAAEYLTYALRTLPVRAKPALRQTLSALFEEARAKVGALVVRTDVDGARVFVDGVLRGLTPLPDPVFVEPGVHTTTIEHEQYETERMVSELGAGGTIETGLQMRRKAAGTPVPEQPEVSVAPSESHAAPPESSVVPQARSGEEHDGGPRTGVLIGGAATAGAAAIAGVVFTALAVTMANDAEEMHNALVRESGPEACSRASAPPACANLRDTDDAHIRWANGAILSFTAAGVIGAGTAIYWLVTRPSEAHEHVRAVPIVGAHGVGLSVSGGF